MRKRGRPPHPDILTPREWQVLELLRRSLSNEQIAERLTISLDGAKYHVSEILSKLGVSSREEAATWQPPVEKALWRRAVALPLVAKAAGLAFTAAAIAGLVVLAIGVVQTRYDASSSDNYDRYQALLPATSLTGEIASVTVQITDTDPRDQTDSIFGGNSFVSDGTERWVVSITGRFLQFWIRFRTSDERPCVEVTYWFREEEWAQARLYPFLYPRFDVVPLDDSACDYDSISSDVALIIAADAGVRSDHLVPAVEQTTFRRARDVIPGARLGAEPQPSGDTTVWLATVTDTYTFISPTPFGAPPATPRIACQQRAAVIDASTGEVLLESNKESSQCP